MPQRPSWASWKAPATRERTLERASLREWAQWRRDFEKKHRRSGCKVCVASEWKTKVRRAVAQAFERGVRVARLPVEVIWRRTARR